MCCCRCRWSVEVIMQICLIALLEWCNINYLCTRFFKWFTIPSISPLISKCGIIKNTTISLFPLFFCMWMRVSTQPINLNVLYAFKYIYILFLSACLARDTDVYAYWNKMFKAKIQLSNKLFFLLAYLINRKWIEMIE